MAADRRGFLKAAGIAAAGTALPIGAASWATPAAAQTAQTAQTAQRRETGGNASQRYTIGKRKLGGLEVSELGFGCMSNSPGHYGPGVDRATIFTTDLDGHVINKLPAPTPDQMTVPAVKAYFADPKGTFVPTDAVQFDGRYYISTGYSALDYVLTAKVTSTSPFTTEWDGLAFGGKGDGDGQFRTGHGITVHPDGKSLVLIASGELSSVGFWTGESMNGTSARSPKVTVSRAFGDHASCAYSPNCWTEKSLAGPPSRSGSAMA